MWWRAQSGRTSCWRLLGGQLGITEVVVTVVGTMCPHTQHYQYYPTILVPLSPSTSHSLSSHAMPPPSPVNNHFFVVTITDSETSRKHQKRKCRPCADAGNVKLFALGSSTTTRRDHLENDHADIPLPPRNADAHSKRARIETQQPDIKQSLILGSNRSVRPALAELFASCSWAHHCIEWPQFIAALDAYRSSTIRPPSRAALRQDIINLSNDMRVSVINRLRGYCRYYPLTIAIDGWTNVRQDKVTNVLVLCGGNAFYWCSIVNVSERNTAVWMHAAVRDVLYDIKGEGLCFSALVADNEQVNKTLHSLLLADFKFLVRSPCAAHLVQLCVNHALSLPAIEPILLEMEELLYAFRLKANRIKLRQVQMAIHNTYLAILKPCDTRWSSHLAAARRLLRIRNSIDSVLPQSPQFWVNLTEIERFLVPFATATNVVQADTSTLYDFYKQFKLISKHVHDTPASSPFHAAKDSITNVIIGVWEKHVSWEAIIITAHLSFDSTVDTAFADKVNGARRWFTDWAAKYASYWELSGTTDESECRSAATNDWSQYMSRAPGSSFEQLDKDIAELKDNCRRNGTLFDPRKVWSLYLDEAPVIAHAAIALLSVAGSEAAVERSFSAQGTVHSDRRNRMTDKMVEAEMYIRFNRLALRRASGEVKSSSEKTAEIVDDDEENDDDDAASSVADLFKRIAVPVLLPEQDEKQPQQQPQQPQQQDEQPPQPAVVRSLPRPRPSDNDIERFISEYVRTHNITARFKWRDHHEQQLQAAAVNSVPLMLDTVMVLKKKMMAYVRGLDVVVGAVAAEDVMSVR